MTTNSYVSYEWNLWKYLGMRAKMGPYGPKFTLTDKCIECQILCASHWTMNDVVEGKFRLSFVSEIFDVRQILETRLWLTMQTYIYVSTPNQLLCVCDG
jgi:hypothetical protein